MKTEVMAEIWFDKVWSKWWLRSSWTNNIPDKNKILKAFLKTTADADLSKQIKSIKKRNYAAESTRVNQIG